MKKVRRETGDVVVGIDQSADGTAAISLVDGRLGRFLFFADTKKSFVERAGTGKGVGTAASFGDGHRVVAPVPVKGTGDEVGKTRRLRKIRDELVRFLSIMNPTHVAFEGYSETKAPRTARTLGEVGGIVRVLLADLGFPYRVYPIEAIKSFATGNGAAEKGEMILACRDRWEEINWHPYGKTAGAAGNLADAYVITQLLRLELRVRAGEEEIMQIDRVSREVLQRTTPKRQPVSILETPFAEVPE